MDWKDRNFIRNLGFRHQMVLAFSLGIILLALTSSFAISTISKQSLYQQTLNQGINVTKSFANQSLLALLYDSEENAKDVAKPTLAFPDITAVIIYNADHSTLYAEGKVQPLANTQKIWPKDAPYVEESEYYWHITAPVIGELSESNIEPDAFETAENEHLGFVTVIVSKKSLIQLNDKLLKSNFLISILLASILLIVLLLLTNNITRPLKSLIDLMNKSDKERIKVRANLEGPKDIVSMEIAFNNMMDELEARENELKRARDSALGAAHAKGEFAANVSHELRTPMNGIMGMLELLNDSSLAAKQLEYIKVARNSGKALLSLIDEILDFSKLESTKMRLNEDHFCLNKLLSEISELLSTQAESKSIQLECEVSSNFDTNILADSNRVRQVIINLIGNALKFTHQGTISILANKVIKDDKNFIKITVSDTGIGIPKNAQHKIFEAFAQADTSTTRKYGGTGLGLTICKQLVELMGGSIGLTSEPGVGSEFWFTFPLINTEGLSETKAYHHEPLSGEKVLIIGGNDGAIEDFVKIFSDWNIEIQSAKKGRTAIVANNAALAQHNPFYCVFIIPPVLDFDLESLCLKLCEEDNGNQTKIIILGDDTRYHKDRPNNNIHFIDPKIDENELYSLLIDKRESYQAGLEPMVSVRPAVPHTSDAKILIVEDNRANQLVALGMMERLGYQAEVADNGLIALKILKQTHFDIVLMDCSMPEMDGFACTQEIRSNDSGYKNIPIIAMTALVDPKTQSDCKEVGMNDYIAKPIELTELDTKIEFWLESSGQKSDKVESEQAATEAIDNSSIATSDNLTQEEWAFNKEQLQNLQTSLGETFNRVLESIFEDTPLYLSQLKRAIELKDKESITLHTHKIRNAALNLCAEPLNRLCLELETSKSSRKLEQARDAYNGIEAEFYRLKAQIKSAAFDEHTIEVQPLKQTILVVDDDPSARFALQGVLERDGYHIVTANDGQQAVDTCNQAMPDLVLMDVMMPNMDGFTACKNILKLDNKTHPAILLVTALNDEESIEKAFNSGATDFIPKPVNLMVLRKRVAHLLQSRTAEQYIHKLAHFDNLTNLPNRTLFVEKARDLLRVAKTEQKIVALLFLDLDRFKLVNDTQGHQVGDLLLKTAAQRLKGSLRNADTIARLGGDEFVILLDNIKSTAAIAKVADKVVKKLSQPFSFMQQQVYVSASVGISVFNNSNNNDIYLLMKQADTAMYEAKAKGGSCFRFYEHGMEIEIARRVELEKELHHAIDNDELVLFYQAQQSLDDNSISCVEALIRWQHPTRGLLAPAEFIPVAEESGLILALGEWVIDSACQQIKAWQNNNIEFAPVAINVSTHQIENGDLFEKIESILDRHKVDAKSLKVEITENSLVNIDEHIIAQLEKIAAIGVTLAIDDFGTGYSSLNYLKRFPVTTLKIDRCFIKDMVVDTADASIVSGIIALGHSLNLSIVAEGVETKEQLALLGQQGCDYIQGYYFSRPLPNTEFEQFLLSYRDKADL